MDFASHRPFSIAQRTPATASGVLNIRKPEPGHCRHGVGHAPLVYGGFRGRGEAPSSHELGPLARTLPRRLWSRALVDSTTVNQAPSIARSVFNRRILSCALLGF